MEGVIEGGEGEKGRGANGRKNVNEYVSKREIRGKKILINMIKMLMMDINPRAMQSIFKR